MKDYLRSIIKQSLQQFDLSDDDIPEIQIEKPNQPEHGDAASNIAMNLASVLKMNPRKIAEQIVEGLEYDKQNIQSVEIAGPGFINFRYAENYLFDELADILSEGSTFGKSDSLKGKRILVEFVSANPTGPLTVGHGRNAVLGDTVANLLEWSGADVDREYYFNNAGRQMRMLGESVRARYLQLLDQDAELPEEGYEGEYIKNIAQELIDEHGDSLIATEDVNPFKDKAEQIIFDDIKTTLNRMNIEMDSFFNEKEVYADSSIDQAVKTLREKNLAYDKDGATWFRTTEFGKEQDTVLIKHGRTDLSPA